MPSEITPELTPAEIEALNNLTSDPQARINGGKTESRIPDLRSIAQALRLRIISARSLREILKSLDDERNTSGSATKKK